MKQKLKEKYLPTYYKRQLVYQLFINGLLSPIMLLLVLGALSLKLVGHPYNIITVNNEDILPLVALTMPKLQDKNAMSH